MNAKHRLNLIAGVVAAGIVVALVVGILALGRPSDGTPEFQTRVQIDQARVIGQTATVPIEMTNSGDGPAEEVVVNISVEQPPDTPGGEPVTEDWDQSISEIAHGETVTIEVNTDANPATIVVEVRSWVLP